MYKSILLAFLLAVSSHCQSQNIVKGCFQWNSFTNSCALCYRRKYAAIGGCGSLLPSNDTCLIHKEPAGSNATICALCASGYALNTTSGGCKQASIFDCLNTQYDGKTVKCLVCAGGQYPTSDGSLCAPPESSSRVIRNCQWGGPNNTCYKCAPGYVLTRNSQGCHGQFSSTRGCLQLNSNGSTCFVCDAFNGYSMQKDGTCKFVPQ